MKAFFISGTDTDVGKTLVSCTLLESFKQQGYRSVALKPVAAGCELVDEELKNQDAVMLQRYMSAELAYHQVNPVALEAAVAPHIAALKQSEQISLKALLAHAQCLLKREEDVCLIEGAGGWRVPLDHNSYLSDLPKALKIPVILVVDMRLGCLNHTLLSQQAILADGLHIVAWIANHRAPQLMTHYEENLQTLMRVIDAPCLAQLPYLTDPSVTSAMPFFEREAITALLDADTP